jgi:hypothetical protein
MKKALSILHPTIVAIALTGSIATLYAGHSYADAHPGRYVVKSGIVYDTKTKLTWQQEAAPSPLNWMDAKAYCESLGMSNLEWRLPSVKELETLVDESRVNPAIDRTAFPNTQGRFFWTSSLVTNFNTSGWVVDFNRGGDLFFDLSTAELVRCVH